MKKQINSVRKVLLYSVTRWIKGGKRDASNPIEIDNIRRVLISRPNSRLGNLLMVTPLVQDIQRQLPNAKIDLFVRGGVGYPIFENYSNVENLIVLPSKPFKELVKYMKVWWKMRKEKYDLVLNVIPNSSSGRLSAQLSTASLKDFGDEIEMLKKEYVDYGHMAKLPVYNFRNLLKDYGLENDMNYPMPTLSFNLTNSELLNSEKVYQNLIGNDKPTIYIYTYATGNKCLTSEWWLSFYEKLKIQFDAYNIVEVLPKEKISQVNFIAPSYYSIDLHEMSGVISKGSLFITADCGVMHLASASNIPTLGLFNITSIDCYGPYNGGSKAVYSDKVNQDDIIKLANDMLNVYN